MTIIPLDKLEQLRREQRREETDDRPVLYAPMPVEVLSGSVPQEETQERGVEIIDFTI